MFLRKSFTIALFAALMPTLAVAEIVVSHFEPLQQSVITKTSKDSQSFGSSSSRSDSISLRFYALGKDFDLRLQTNDRVASGLRESGAESAVEVYRGQLANNANSWARIVIFAGVPRGMIWDGKEMFAIEAPGDSTIAVDSAVIYRLADAHISAGTMSCGADSLSGNAALVTKAITSSSKAALAMAPGAVSEITLSAIGDFEFTNARGGDNAAAAAISTRLNNVDGYFSEQVGVQLNVQPVETHSDADDPFTDTSDSSLLLDELSEYRLQTASHNEHGLTHLWTGRNLDGTTVGIAWRGTLCENYFGTGLSEGNNGSFVDGLIAAHEIGHNFGAQHDGEPSTPCEDDTDSFIMSASVNGSEQFSQCSIDIMQAMAAASSCVTALPTVDVSIAPSGAIEDLLVGVPTELEYDVSSNGTLTAPAVDVSFAIPNELALDAVNVTAGSCTDGGSVVDCSIGDLVGLATETITLSVTPTAVGATTVTATASTNGDERASNNQHVAQLNVITAVDLSASVPTAAAVNLNANTTVTANIENLSAFAATNVSIDVSLELGLQAVAASWSAGTCTVTAQHVDCQANTLSASSTSTLTVTATGVTSGRRDVTLVLASAEPDTALADNTVTGEVVVRDPDERKDDSGGAVNPFLLLLGWLAIAGRRRRQRV